MLDKFVWPARLNEDRLDTLRDVGAIRVVAHLHQRR